MKSKIVAQLSVTGFVCLFIMMPLGGFCHAQTNSLAVSLGKEHLTTLDPAFSNTRQTLVLYHNWADTLLYRDPASRELVPCLAQSYRFCNATTIEFSLRPGIQFHNGEPFNAQSVKFSLEVLKQPDSLVSYLLENITAAFVVDLYTVQIEVVAPNPNLEDLFANVFFIYPPNYYRQVGPDEFGKNPIGTGPYQFVKWQKPNNIHFKRNPNYFESPKGIAHIPNLEIHIIPEEILQVEALLDGRIHLARTGTVSPEQLPFLVNSQSIKTTSVDTLRNFFVLMDAAGRSGIPYFQDKRVRKAVNHAIDREKIIRNAFFSMANRIDSVTSAMHVGHEPDVTSYTYNPQKAKQLLADAGYASGFKTDFYAVRNESAAELIIHDLETVGIELNVHWMGGKWDQLYQKLLAGKVPIAFLTWGSYSIFDASAILNPFFLPTSDLCYGYTAAIGQLLKIAEGSQDQQFRTESFSTVQKMIADQAFWVPICSRRAVSVMQRNLIFHPSCDEVDRYFTAKWVE